MIGYCGTGMSFKGTLEYCLKDKHTMTDQQKIEKSRIDGLQHKERAEVLEYHNCFIRDVKDIDKLASQFIRVAKLSERVEKPVFHFSLRIAPEDKLSKEQWIEVGRQCAKEYGVENNQYVTILHKDTNQKHIHIVANRVGLDGKVAKDTYSVKRMHALCRRLEQEFHLKEVLSSRTFLPEELRHLPRLDSRKEKLKTDIQQILMKVKTYSQFEEKMKSLGYVVLKGRGICFIDDKEVRIKGSEVGFSLSKIERILELKQQLEVEKAKEKIFDIGYKKLDERPAYTPKERLLKETVREAREEQSEVIKMENIIHGLIHGLLKPEYSGNDINPELMKEAKRKRKRLRQRL